MVWYLYYRYQISPRSEPTQWKIKSESTNPTRKGCIWTKPESWVICLGHRAQHRNISNWFLSDVHIRTTTQNVGKWGLRNLRCPLPPRSLLSSSPAFGQNWLSEHACCVSSLNTYDPLHWKVLSSWIYCGWMDTSFSFCHVSLKII